MALNIDHLPVFTGEIPNIEEILNTLTSSKGADWLRTQVKSKGLATVTSRQSGEEIVLPSRRQCNRWTFGEDMVSKLDDILREIVSFYVRGAIEPNGVEFDLVNIKSHGDVLLYEKGDFFREHRDTVEEKPPLVSPEDYYHYSLLLALIDTEEGGETGIITPMDGIQKKVLYTETTKKGNFLLFPSEQMHFGNEIRCGTKMVLKMDYWINIPTWYVMDYFNDPHDQYDNYLPSEDDDSWCNGYHI